jgi:hypothetical protein
MKMKWTIVGSLKHLVYKGNKHGARKRTLNQKMDKRPHVVNFGGVD